MNDRRTPWWLHLSLALPLATIVVAAALVLRGEREAVRREARTVAQRVCDEAAEGFIKGLAATESRPLPSTDERGHLREDGFLFSETPSPQPSCEAQAWFAKGEFERVLKDAPEAKSLAGLPLGPLSAWQLMLQARDKAALGLAWRRLVTLAVDAHPSAITRALLDKGDALLKSRGWSDEETGMEPILNRWASDNALRKVIRENEAELLHPTMGWVGEKKGMWLQAMLAWVYDAHDLEQHRPDDQTGWRIVGTAPVFKLCSALQDDAKARLPTFTRLRLRLGTMNVGEPLASDEQTIATTDKMMVRAFVVMAENADFQRAVWQRMRWTGSALALAFVLCALGAWQVLRGYRRQQQLAEQQSNFISSVSHELRAPLSSVRLMAESLCDGTVSEAERVAEYHRVMHEESTRLCSLVENVLDTARIERGVKNYTFAPCDPASLIESATRILSPRAERHEVSWRIECASFDPLPQADENALRQALVNLLDNALKHAPERTTITITAARLDVDHWTLSVADQGPGIPAAERERVFERFYRIGSELRRETTGAGLGLALVKHVVIGHCGTVTISDAPGGGALVMMSLPLNPENPSAA